MLRASRSLVMIKSRATYNGNQLSNDSAIQLIAILYLKIIFEQHSSV